MAVDDAPPEKLTRTLVGRSDFDFGVLLDEAPQLAAEETAKFYIAEHRRITRDMIISYFLSLGAGLFALGFISTERAGLSLFGIGLEGIEISPAIPIFLMGIFFTWMIQKMISSMILSRFIRNIYSRFSIHSHDALIARWNADQLWADVIIPRQIGYSSGIAHKILIGLTLIVILAMFGSIILFCNGIAWVGALGHREDGLAHALLAFSGAVSVTLSTAFLVVSTAIPFQFTFKPAEGS